MKSDTSSSWQELVQYYGWDETLSKLLFSLPRWAIDRYITEARNYDRDGWRYILPEFSPSASILCLDTRFGNTAAAFAEAGASVTVIHYCPVMVRLIEHQLATMNIMNVNKIIQVAPEVRRLPFADESFDAFILHDIGGTLSIDHTMGFGLLIATSAALFAEIYRIIKLNGFAYFGLKNRFGYDNIKKKLFPKRERNVEPIPCEVSMRRIAHLIEQAGFQNLQTYPYLVERGRVSEVVPDTGYRSLRNSFAMSEKLKQIVLGKIGTKYLAPAYGLVCAKNNPHPSQILGFARNLVAQKILDTLPKIQPYFQRYLSLPGKVFITLNKINSDNQNIIIIIPTMTPVLNWRRKEIAIVNEVRTLSPYLASKLPPLYCELSWRGKPYFAISEMPGITVDRRVPHLDRLTCQAVDFLIKFNQITARKTVIDEDIYVNLVRDIIDQVMSNYPSIRDIMIRIEHLLRATLIDKCLLVVWFHGDYKLENLLIDKGTLEISSIIDWEQSRRHGLPWLDLLYLLTYNRIMTEYRDFFNVYREVIEAENFTSSERRLIDAYNMALPVAPGLKPILVSLFFIHHIGCRAKYNMSIEGCRLNIFDGLERIEKRLMQLTVQ